MVGGCEAPQDPERDMSSSSTFMVVLNQISVTGAPLSSKMRGSHYQAAQMIISFVRRLFVLALSLLTFHFTVIP